MNSSLSHRMPVHRAGAIPQCENAVEWLTVDCGDLPASAAVSRFRGIGGVMECHVTVSLNEAGGQSPAMLEQAYQCALETAGLSADTAVFRRYFCSDVANQSALLEMETPAAATSIIGQTPLPAAKFALWAQHLADPAGPLDRQCGAPGASCRRHGLVHHWTTGVADNRGSDSFEQTRGILEAYDDRLSSGGMTMADHVIRTWWFVRDIDSDYQGLVDARREFFASHGLTSDTHYIASTGIAGTPPGMATKVSLDAYAIQGLQPDQVEHLCAPNHLCPTHHYGVTFERATAVSYADRRHVFVSGTASIDHTGNILHEGDVIRQLDRTLENIDVLLAKAGANLGDLASILVYLRDPADGRIIQAGLRERLGAMPFVLVHAPVCRPGWLIEIEGIAVVSVHRPELPRF